MGTITIVTIIIIEGSAYRKFIVFSFWTPTSLSCNIKMPVLYSMCHTIWCPSLSLRVLLPLLFCRETLDPSWSPFLLPSSMSPSLWFLILCLPTSTNLSLKKKKNKMTQLPLHRVIMLFISFLYLPNCLHLRLLSSLLSIYHSGHYHLHFPLTTLWSHSPKCALLKVN